VFIIIGGALVALSVLTYLINRISGGEEGLNFVEVWALFQDYGSGWREGDLRLNDTASPLAPIEFLLRPYFWEISGPAVFISWIDSTVMTVAGVYLLLQVPFLDKIKAPWMFAIFVTLLLALTNPNVGTSHRKKQIFPIAAIIVVSEAFLRRRRDRKSGKTRYFVRVPSSSEIKGQES